MNWEEIEENFHRLNGIPFRYVCGKAQNSKENLFQEIRSPIRDFETGISPKPRKILFNPPQCLYFSFQRTYLLPFSTLLFHLYQEFTSINRSQP
jgi:hypothetical protein